MARKARRLQFVFSEKHLEYIRSCRKSMYNIAEGAIRAGKTIDNVFAFSTELEYSPDKIHLASGSTSATAKLNIGDCNGFGLEYQYRGRCRWGKFKGNECLYLKTKTGEKVVIFAGAGKADSFKRIRGNSYGMWIATEINLHHDSFIKEAFNRTAAAGLRKFFWDLNPSNPGAAIYKDYIDLYREKHDLGELPGGCNYQLFTLADNATISETRRKEIISQYDSKSVWYRRDILGMRCVADGLCFPQFADDPGKYKTSNPDYDFVQIGVDFGGNKSAHAFVATGIKRGVGIVYLMSRRISAKGVTPTALYQAYGQFLEDCKAKYPGQYAYTFADCAEQTLIAGMAAQYSGIRNSIKNPILDRIRGTNSLIAQNRLHYTGDCETLVQAMCTAVWDEKKNEDVRLDNGTSDIDTLDAAEYSWERYLYQLVQVSGGVKWKLQNGLESKDIT